MSESTKPLSKSSIVAKLLEEKELDQVFGGSGSFTQRIDCPPCGPDGKAFWMGTHQN
jgi:hypothetical protein